MKIILGSIAISIASFVLLVLIVEIPGCWFGHHRPFYDSINYDTMTGRCGLGCNKKLYKNSQTGGKWRVVPNQ